jgi:hypothetical protein
MARSRNIKPSFFKNEDLAELPFSTRLLFIGLWLLADREGRLEDRPKRIKMEVFPSDSIDVENALVDLDKFGFIRRYESDGARFIEICSFVKHQNPHPKEAPSVIPKPAPAVERYDPAVERYDPAVERYDPAVERQVLAGLIPSSLIPSSLIPDSPTPPRAAREDPPVDAKPEKKAKARRSAKTPLPEDFKISERVTAWASGKGFTDLDRHLEHFVSKARAKGYVYADWDEGFMGAVREDWAQLRLPGEKASGADPPLFADAWRSYPRRDGNNPVLEAREAWSARVAEGCDPKAMLAGTLRYAEWCRANGKIGTEYVLQGVTFYGDGRPFEQSFVIASEESKPILDHRCIFIDPSTGVRCEESVTINVLTLGANGSLKHVFGCCNNHYYPAVNVGRELQSAPELIEIIARFKESLECSPSSPQAP